MISADEVRKRINERAAKGQPFLFGVDFELKEGFFVENPLEQQDILFSVGATTNCPKGCVSVKKYDFRRHPISYKEYNDKFEVVRKGLMCGDSFLLNLTVTTEVFTSLSLRDIFMRSSSLYRLCIPERLVCFSPECFVRIEKGQISSFPMKGTISASIPDAEQIILNDYKEKAEHYTIVDLIRNDLNRVAVSVAVNRFRYIDRLETSNGTILQVSSEVFGELPDDYRVRLGDIIFDLLPAGSISGAPKVSTVNIISEAEKGARGFYTGVFGYFDGERLDSAVMIRYIEQKEGRLFFRSGGGITINSSCEDEYNEVLEKVYLPF